MVQRQTFAFRDEPQADRAISEAALTHLHARHPSSPQVPSCPSLIGRGFYRSDRVARPAEDETEILIRSGTVGKETLRFCDRKTGKTLMADRSGYWEAVLPPSVFR